MWLGGGGFGGGGERVSGKGVWEIRSAEGSVEGEGDWGIRSWK